MGVKEYKPTSAGRRFMSGLTFDEISKDKPEKSLLKPIKKTGGRNHSGKITTRHIGGGHKRRLRIIDFKRNKFEIWGRLRASNMTPTVRRTSPLSTISTARSATFWPRLA